MTVAPAKIRFLADEDFNAHIVVGLRHRRPTLDIRTAEEAHILGMSDPSILAFAALQGRLLVSHDLRTMRHHFDTFLASGQESPGLVLIVQTLPIRDAIEALLLLWEASDPVEWHNSRIHLPL